MSKPIRLFIFLGVCILTAIIGYIDFLIGTEFSSALFYFAPIFIAAWYLDRNISIMIALFCAASWATNDYLLHNYLYKASYFWNSLMRLFIFMIIALLVSSLRKSLDEINVLANVDPLTGAKNHRFIYAFLYNQIAEFKRSNLEFSIIYFDVDNFKEINDRYGHDQGDEALKIIVNKCQENIHKHDIIGRVGGDEFIIVLPETKLNDAEKLYKRIFKDISLVKKPFSIRLSAGIASYDSSAYSLDELLKTADMLMYSSKKNGGNNSLSKKLI
ncbi:GGDEF domain-containing protein [Legionella yabuuchiae]|uniref:GGDEF domain-containing protein n=1 Tax=Legionella yabuuchiae TaxID=376727 RepID=UPI001054F2FF|nr:GGDEF domain-containing protein [Legionella yabuuchiae]